jgi:hypothetical protein
LGRSILSRLRAVEAGPDAAELEWCAEARRHIPVRLALELAGDRVELVENTCSRWNRELLERLRPLQLPPSAMGERPCRSDFRRGRAGRFRLHRRMTTPDRQWRCRQVRIVRDG